MPSAIQEKKGPVARKRKRASYSKPKLVSRGKLSELVLKARCEVSGPDTDTGT
jgi:hypothetical protein